MNGSKVIEIFSHTGQTNVDLYWPWSFYCRKIKKKNATLSKGKHNEIKVETQASIENTVKIDRNSRRLTEKGKKTWEQNKL